MTLPNLKDSDRYSKDDLAILGARLKRILLKNPVSVINSQQRPEICTELLNTIPPESINTLIDLGLIHQSEDKFKWLFFPLVGNDLIFFSDLPVYNLNAQFVWLKETSTSTSWKFALSLPVKQGTTLLDLGTGAGLSALIATQRGAISVGIDINSRAIALASLNKCLNALEKVRFEVSDWKEFNKEKFDVIVSQPPFDPHIEGIGASYAFNGGGFDGFAATKEIINLFKPKANQMLMLYFHSFENESNSYLQNLMNQLIDDNRISIRIEPQKTFTLEDWWKRFKLRRGMNLETPLPIKLHSFTKRVAYFVYLQGKKYKARFQI